MPSGKTHTKINFIGLPFIVAPLFLYDQIDQKTIFIYTIGFLVGTFLLTPDLDMKSDAYFNWGILRFIWIPYQKMIPHRSPLSHGLLIGDTIRLLYLAFLSYPFLTYGGQDLDKLMKNHGPTAFVFVIGVMTASTFHIALDFFTTKRKKKRKRR